MHWVVDSLRIQTLKWVSPETAPSPPGPGSPAEALEPVPDPVRQQRGEPLGRAALGVLHGVVHHRGAGLLHHRRPLRTHERQRLPRRRRVHTKGQPLRLTPPHTPPSLTPPLVRLQHVWSSTAPEETHPGARIKQKDSVPEADTPEGNYHFNTLQTSIPNFLFSSCFFFCFTWTKMLPDSHSVVAARQDRLLTAGCWLLAA